jgi:hypothetical protein
MLRRRIKIGFLSALAILFSVVLLSLILSNDAKLDEFITNALIRENVTGVNDPAALFQSVIIRLSNVKAYEGPRTALKAWRYTSDGLTSEDSEIFLIATGTDRSHWPPYTIEFDVKYMTPLIAIVQIATLYDQGILPTSRGGHADTWVLVNFLGNWLIVDKRSGEYWD